MGAVFFRKPQPAWNNWDLLLYSANWTIVLICNKLFWRQETQIDFGNINYIVLVWDVYINFNVGISAWLIDKKSSWPSITSISRECLPVEPLISDPHRTERWTEHKISWIVRRAKTTPRIDRTISILVERHTYNIK